MVKSAPVDKDEENLVATLSNQNSKLKNQYGIIIEKNKQLVELLEKKKREISMLKRSVQVQAKSKSNPSLNQSKENMIPQDVEIRAAATNFMDRNTNTNSNNNNNNNMGNAAPLNAQTDSNLLEIARKYKAR